MYNMTVYTQGYVTTCHIILITFQRLYDIDLAKKKNLVDR